MRDDARALLEGRVPREEASKWQRFVHFWVLVAQSFSRNRCPVRASALAYATLLALIPMLVVVMSVTSTFLKKRGEEGIEKFIDHMVASVTPPAAATANLISVTTNLSPSANSRSTNAPAEAGTAPETSAGDAAATQTAPGAADQDQHATATRRAIARSINQFIQNTRSGALGLTGSVVLIFAALSLLSQIETTFNDIWGVARGRSWFMRIVLYWSVLTLAPLLLVVALGLTTGPHLEATRQFLGNLPLIGSFIFHFGFELLPVLVLCLTFAAFYMLMPNTKVYWRAALAGGAVAGLLFHLNNVISVLYVSRVVSNSKIYGSLGLVPVFMIGLYFCWLILLFGAQVAYAYQNRSSYLEEKQVELINQRGREFIALRLMTLVGQRFLRGQPPPEVPELAEALCVPTRLIQQIMEPLCAVRLVVETANGDSGYVPARPLENITCHDILLALRASQGQELATRDEPARAEVYGEFQRILEAERHAAASVTLLALASRAGASRELTE
ncbi:MAG TPA: YhjD/YihY/BrkB family envelope integrity protein [Candidatus Binatia bacterium]|jgi:membrane protein|nr:YhjD/YihY/BrkB family envelope integrity protein [Candidatus Binatia bacterium]